MCRLCLSTVFFGYGTPLKKSAATPSASRGVVGKVNTATMPRHPGLINSSRFLQRRVVEKHEFEFIHLENVSTYCVACSFDRRGLILFNMTSPYCKIIGLRLEDCDFNNLRTFSEWRN